MMSDHRVTETRTFSREPGRTKRHLAFNEASVVLLLFGILEGLIALHIGQKLTGTNPADPMAAFIVDITSFFLLPFAWLTGTAATGGMALDVSAVIAMLAYALIAWALERKEINRSTQQERRVQNGKQY